MSVLIKIKEQNGQRAVNARELHQFLEVKTQFKDWINRRIDEYGFIENQDFEVLLKNEQNSNGGRPSKEYALSLDMAKELSMVEKTEKGRQARRYFIELEKVAKREIKVVLPNRNKEIQAELFELIRANLLKGDVLKIAKEVGVSKNTVQAVMYNNTYSSEIVRALYNKAMENKNVLRLELEQMIENLKS